MNQKPFRKRMQLLRKGVNWQVNGIDGGNSTVGIVAEKYTAPSAVPAAGSVPIAAVSHADSTKSATSTVTLLNPVPTIQSLSARSINTQLAFRLTVKGTNFNSNALPVLDDGTVLTVVNRSATSARFHRNRQFRCGKTLHLTITNPALGAVTSIPRSIVVNPPVTIKVTPATATVRAGSSRDFNASVGNNTDQTVIWTVNGKAGGDSVVGTIDTKGLYTAPLVLPDTPTVSATNVADPRNPTPPLSLYTTPYL